MVQWPWKREEGEPTFEGGNFRRGALFGLTSALIFVLVPLLFIGLAAVNYPGVVSGFNTTLQRVLVMGTLLTILGYYEGFYQLGSRRRLLAGITQVGALLLWFFLLLGRASFERRFEEYTFTIEFAPLVVMFMAGISLKAAYAGAQFLHHREGYARLTHCDDCGTPLKRAYEGTLGECPRCTAEALPSPSVA
jgi:lysylphosphatidylglycerol synthetase-like protein (DUF2156 family)